MTVKIVNGNILEADTEAVVNAANERLLRGSGVCGAIFEAADSTALGMACRKIGYCSEGDAVITPSFGLKAEYIIHAVGPVWKGGAAEESLVLSGCYRRVLEVAEENGIRSVAFPLISAGVFRFPPEKAWEAALFSCIDSELEIYFMIPDRNIYDMGIQILKEMESQVVCFDNDRGLFECFSNWYRAPFSYAGRKYSSVETYMMIQKTELFGEYGLADMIREADDPAEAKRIGRTPMERFDPQLWYDAGYNIVKRGVRAKFLQHPEYAEILKATGNMDIAECNEADSIWGIGLSLEDDRRFDRESWRGENRLGRILMEIREEFKDDVSYDEPGPEETERLMKKTPSDFGDEYAVAIDTYRVTLSDDMKRVFDSGASFAEMKNLPEAGFKEMLQEIYDIGRRYR